MTALTVLHCWEFDSNLSDEVGGWTLAGTVTYSTGKIGNALSPLKYATYSSGAYNLGTGSWSASAWVKPTNAYSGDALFFLQIGGMEFFYTANNTTDDYIRVRDIETSLIAAETDYDRFFTLNTWHHIAVTRTAGGVCKIYLDGVLLKTTTLASITDTLGIVACGDREGTYTSTDQVAVAEVCWTADDIAFIYNAGSGRAYASWEVAEEDDDTLRNHFFL